MKNFHLFHLIPVSPWPLLSSIGALNIVLSLLLMFHKKLFLYVFVSVLMVLTISMYWWENISSESFEEGWHSNKVKSGLKMGMLLFIVSEIFFFISFFWSFIHFSLNPGEMISIFPPAYISPFNPVMIPLLNTLILISSGCSLTVSHHLLLNNSKEVSKKYLMITIFLGFMFTLCQGLEYINSTFSINDSCYSSIFFMGTGFHGLHVLVGTFYLFWNFIHFSSLSLNSHISFEFAAWYWHFVDVVWLILYMLIYWWSI